MKFKLNEAQLAKLKVWRKERDDAWAKKHPSPFGDDLPYYGAIGGSLTYSFTPTSIGTVVIIKHADDMKLDLSDEGGFG